jgi:hypothetical protein
VSDKKGLFSFLNFDSIVANLSGYVEKRIELFKIEMKEDVALGAARLLIMLVLSLALFMLILFLSLGGAVLLNRTLDSDSLGFLLVAGFYLLIFILFFLLKDTFKFEEKLKSIILEMFNNMDDENGNE